MNFWKNFGIQEMFFSFLKKFIAFAKEQIFAETLNDKRKISTH
jgi:hypothetical protein